MLFVYFLFVIHFVCELILSFVILLSLFLFMVLTLSEPKCLPKSYRIYLELEIYRSQEQMVGQRIYLENIPFVMIILVLLLAATSNYSKIMNM